MKLHSLLDPRLPTLDQLEIYPTWTKNFSSPKSFIMKTSSTSFWILSAAVIWVSDSRFWWIPLEMDELELPFCFRRSHPEENTLRSSRNIRISSSLPPRSGGSIRQSRIWHKAFQIWQFDPSQMASLRMSYAERNTMGHFWWDKLFRVGHARFHSSTRFTSE